MEVCQGDQPATSYLVSVFELFSLISGEKKDRHWRVRKEPPPPKTNPLERQKRNEGGCFRFGWRRSVEWLQLISAKLFERSDDKPAFRANHLVEHLLRFAQDEDQIKVPNDSSRASS